MAVAAGEYGEGEFVLVFFCRGGIGVQIWWKMRSQSAGMSQRARTTTKGGGWSMSGGVAATAPANILEGRCSLGGEARGKVWDLGASTDEEGRRGGRGCPRMRLAVTKKMMRSL